jgi:hypothetical protein
MDPGAVENCGAEADGGVCQHLVEARWQLVDAGVRPSCVSVWEDEPSDIRASCQRADADRPDLVGGVDLHLELTGDGWQNIVRLAHENLLPVRVGLIEEIRDGQAKLDGIDHLVAQEEAAPPEGTADDVDVAVDLCDEVGALVVVERQRSAESALDDANLIDVPEDIIVDAESVRSIVRWLVHPDSMSSLTRPVLRWVSFGADQGVDVVETRDDVSYRTASDDAVKDGGQVADVSGVQASEAPLDPGEGQFDGIELWTVRGCVTECNRVLKLQALVDGSIVKQERVMLQRQRVYKRGKTRACY